jgi:diguanylate cyclase (GGDEF)-like protein
MAWIGLVEPTSDTIRPVAWAGEGTDYLADLQISRSGSSPYGRGPTGSRWRDRQRADLELWRERGAASTPMNLPLEEIELRHREGRPVWVENAITLVPQGSSGRAEFRGVSRDITARKLAERQLEKLAHFDRLTGLANRDLLTREFACVLASCLRQGEPVTVMLVNLDRFQLINDTLGHSTGDRLLVETALRLRRTLRLSDLIARVGGDEFLIVLPRLGEQDAALLAAALLAVVAEPWRSDGHEVVVTASIGIALAPADGSDQDLLTRKVSLALHDVKEQQPNGYRFFTEELQVRTARILELSNALRFAFERRELRLHYQPQVDTASGTVVGAEALLRWRHPELGEVSPAEFIPVVERIGLILPIGSWVLAEAIRQLQEWMDAGLEPPRLAVFRRSAPEPAPCPGDRVSVVRRTSGTGPPGQRWSRSSENPVHARDRVSRAHRSAGSSGGPGGRPAPHDPGPFAGGAAP